MSDVGQTVEVPCTKSGETLFRVELIAVENPAQVVYNNRTWYCPMDGIDRVTVRKSDLSDYVRPAGGRGGKPLRRYLTDRKVPIELRKRMIVAAKEKEVLWIPGLVHSRGFTDEISCGRYLAEKGLTSLFSSEATILCRITVVL
jgi:tRNA(Ile)-lysidine synthetase-like protein